MTPIPSPKPPPQYSQQLLIRLVRETKSIMDLVKFTTLLIELEEAGDITISSRLAVELKTQDNYFRYGNNVNDNKNHN